ncbi:MAG: tryptophan--tRNA ligase [Pseudomonadota bacterium]
MSKKIVFSGIQPSGQLHLGNYIGAVRQWVQGQQTHDNLLCVVDMHAITVFQDPVELRRSTREGIALLLASGLDPEKCLLYVQSHVPAHAELGWILNCVTPVGWLTRMSQYKEKSQLQKSVGVGLLDYPVLQAADILLFDTDVVPTGEDQRAHIELTRDIAARFNRLYGDTFKIPEARIAEVGAKVMGFDDPTVKMSKSILKDKAGHGVGLLDEPARIRKTLRRAVTDSGSTIAFSDDPAAAGVNNLLTIYRALTGRSEADVLADFNDARGYGDVKKAVAETIVETLEPIQARYRDLMERPDDVEDVLATGARRAAERCADLLATVRERVGFIPPASTR